MAGAEEVNADMMAFWDGQGGRTWVARQAHTDATLQPTTDALLGFAAPVPGERVVDIGCGCGAPTLEFARRVGPAGRVVGMDISGPMLKEGAARARAAGLGNLVWRKADPATEALEPYDLLTSAFGTMFFGDPVAAFANMRKSAAPGARLAILCWRGLEDNPWMGLPMATVARFLPPRPAPKPNAPGMFGFANPDHVTSILTAAGWAAPDFQRFDTDLDIAAGQGLEAAVEQSVKIGAVNSWLRNQPAEVVSAAVTGLREALRPHVTGNSLGLPASMWLIRSAVG